MYRKALSFPAALLAALTTISLTASIATAQDPPAEGGQVPNVGRADPAPGAQTRDYSKIQASGVLTTGQPVLDVSFSPDGRILAALTFQQVFLWDTTTGTPLKPLTFPQAFVRAMDWSADGRFLATGGGGRSDAIKLWDVQTATTLRAFAPRMFIAALAVSPDGTIIATSGFDKKIRLWSVETGQEVRLLEGPAFPVSSLDFSADGQILYSVGGGTGKMLQATQPAGEGGMMEMPGMTPPGNYESMTEFLAWSIADGTRLHHVTLNEGSPNAVLSPDKSQLAVVGSYAVVRFADGPMRRTQTLWSADTMRLWRVPQPNTEAGDPAAGFLPVAPKIPAATPKEKVAVAWSPDSKVCVIDNFLWDGGATPTPLPPGNLNQFTTFAFSPDGRFLAGGGATGVQIWMVP